LHSVRSLLSRATNATPRFFERFFNFRRRSTFGISVPTWLSTPGPVYLRRHECSSKYNPVVEEVELVHANPQYAHARFPSGREAIVPLRDVAPVGGAASGSSPDAEPDTQFAPSRDPFDRSSVPPPEQAEASSETPLRRTYDNQNTCNVEANDVSESEAGPAPSVPETSPQLSPSPADPRVNGNLLRDMELSLTGDHVFRGEDCGDMLPCFARELRLGPLAISPDCCRNCSRLF